MVKKLAFFCLLPFTVLQFDPNAIPIDEQNPGGLKRFTLLSPKQTGIHFNNEIRDERDRNILIYSNYYGGAGVATVDINNDGLQDLFFAGNLVGDKLYLNKGNLEFEDITIKAGIEDNGGWSSGIAVTDVNNDGWSDIYVTRELYDNDPDIRKNKLYINQGNLSFKEEADIWQIDDNQRSRHALFFDYDLDGDPDLFVLNQPPNPGNFSPLKKEDRSKPEYSPRLYQNQGNKFEDVTNSAGLLKAGYPNSVVARDFDGDGWKDLFVANDFEAPDFFYRNNGDGTFTNQIKSAMPHISYFSMGVDAADINNDGLEDLMVLDMVAEDNFRLKANMSGMDPQVFWDVVNKGGHYQYMFNNLHLNQANNQFGDVAAIAGVSSTDWSWSNLIADFDNDGWKDIYVTNGLLRDIRNSDASKTFPQKMLQLVTAYYDANPGAPEKDMLDIVDIQEVLSTLPSVPLQNYMYRNNGDLRFTKVMEEWGMNKKDFANGSAFADLDNDGDLEIIVNNVNEPASVYRNNSNQFENNNYLRIQPVNDKNLPVEGCQISIFTNEGSQFIELASTRGIYSVSEPIAHFGLKTDNRIKKVTVRWPDNSHTEITDVEPNQLLKITKTKTKVITPAKKPEPIFIDKNASVPIDFRHLENPFDDYKKQILLPHKLSQSGPAMAIGDVNGDGLDDVFLGGAIGVTANLFIQKNDHSFELQKNMPWYDHKNQEDVDAIFFDVDNDQDPDIFVVSGGNEYPAGANQYLDRLYINDGTGQFTFAPERLDTYAISGSRVIPCDYDQDDDIDLFVAGKFIPHDYPRAASSVLLVNENGYFKNRTATLAPSLIDIGLVNDGTWVDYNNDKKPDLIIAGEWMPPTIFENDGQRLTKVQHKTGLEDHSGWWFELNADDMDGDGDLDFVGGNLGLNYKYQASTKEPFEVHYDDFDGNGQPDIVLSYYNFGERFPLRGRSCSSQQVPDLKEKFPNYNLFALADLESVYGNANLRKALHLQATNFASMYFENQGNGTFKASKLPVSAQLSNINDILITDINKDGNKDIIAAGNLFVSEIETTRNDAGLGVVLVGDGNGKFESIPARTSGLYAPWDVKKIGFIDIAGVSHLVLAANNDYLKFFELNK